MWDIYEYYVTVGFERRDKNFKITRETYENLLGSKEYLIRGGIAGIISIETVKGAVEINKHEIMFLEVHKIRPTK